MEIFSFPWNFSLTPYISYDIVYRHLETRTIHAGVAELVDARDLKSCVPKERAGSTPVSGTTYRGVEQLAARRAHNPEVAGSSPAAATIKRLISCEISRFSCKKVERRFS